MLRSKVSKTKINAYRTANYRVGLPPSDFVFNIKKRSSHLTDLMALHRCSSAAFLTACNPYGQIAKPNVNVIAQKKLKREIKQTGLPFLEGTGEDPTGRWKREPSLLVLGISMEDAKAFGVKYAQNAIVWVDEHAVPTLVLLS